MVGLEDDEINHNDINATTLYRRMASFLSVKLSCGHMVRERDAACTSVATWRFVLAMKISSNVTCSPNASQI
jgi:hypothetical protein